MDPVEEQVRDGWTQGRSRWPDVDLDPERYTEHVLTLLKSRTANADRLHFTDLYLACACALGSKTAVRAFETTILPEALGPVRAVDAQSAFVDEVMQRVRTKLLVSDRERPPRILEYAGRGSLVAWITVTAVRTALTLLRETKRANRFSEDRWAAALALPDTGDAELDYLKGRYRSEFAEALTRACARLPDRERAVMRLYFAEGLNIDRIGKIYGVHRATVARWIARTREALLASVRDVMGTELEIPPNELSSLDRLVRSQLDVSLGELFDPRETP